MMKYKGYFGSLEVDVESGIIHGEVLGIADVITYQSTQIQGVQQEFEQSVDTYLEFCAELGREPQKPYSGKFVLRLPTDLHRAADLTAKQQGKSLNTWIVEAVTQQLEM